MIQITIPSEALRAAEVLKSATGNARLPIYLLGSAAMGRLRPNSDVDIMAIVERPLPPAVRVHLLAVLMEISGRYPRKVNESRPLEVTIFLRRELEHRAYPAHSEFVYGEWLRAAFDAGKIPERVSNPDFTLLLAQARQHARTLSGPDPANLLPIISVSFIKRSIADSLPTLLDSWEGDARNVILTLVRMWRTLATGDFVPKDEAAAWAISRLPAESASWVAYARDEYLGTTRHDVERWPAAAKSVAHDLGERVAAMT